MGSILHIAPVCELLDGTVFLESEKYFEFCQKYYPNLQVKIEDISSSTSDKLENGYDIVIHSHFWKTKELYRLFPLIKFPVFVFPIKGFV